MSETKATDAKWPSIHRQKIQKDVEYIVESTNLQDGRSMTTFYYYSVNHQSGLQRKTFSKLSYIFLIH